MSNPIIRGIMAAFGVFCAVLGIIGMFVPVLPTTPLLLLASFLLARSSKRLDSWVKSTKAYQSYVVPFKEKQGIEAKVKVRMLSISYVVMAISAFAVRDIAFWNFVVWAILLAVALWLLYLVCFHIPTLDAPASQLENKQQN